MDFDWIEWLVGVVNIGGNVIFFCFGYMIGKVVKFFCLYGMFMSFFKIEQLGIQDLCWCDLCVVGFQNGCICIEIVDDFLSGIELFGGCCVYFVKNNDIGKFDLIS